MSAAPPGAITSHRPEFVKRLAAARLRLARTVVLTDQERQALALHETQEAAEHTAADVLAAVFERLEGREQHELDEIDAAQARLQANMYGVCERCRQPIPLARLRALPAARRCALCQTKHEAGR
jgi:RNA polymerase-binding transcription factor DksA